jgi:hypothetical protein
VHRFIEAHRLAAQRKTQAPQSPFVIDRAGAEAYDRERRARVH